MPFCGSAQIFGVAMPEEISKTFFQVYFRIGKDGILHLGAWFDRLYFIRSMSMSADAKFNNLARKKPGNHFGPLIAGAIALLQFGF